MKKVLVHVSAIRDGDVVRAAVHIERELNPGAWERKKSYVVESGTPGARREFLLEASERVIVETLTNRSVVFDAKQNAAVVREDPYLLEDQDESA